MWHLYEEGVYCNVYNGDCVYVCVHSVSILFQGCYIGKYLYDGSVRGNYAVDFTFGCVLYSRNHQICQGIQRGVVFWLDGRLYQCSCRPSALRLLSLLHRSQLLRLRALDARTVLAGMAYVVDAAMGPAKLYIIAAITDAILQIALAARTG
jgi:hypothetical protein